MEQALSLLDVYNNAFGEERERLSTLMENDYLKFIEETQHRDAKKRFFCDMQTEFNSRYHLGLDGFIFGLVRFESYFDDEMKLFRKKPVEMNFDKAKEKFLASWPNDSRRQYIVDFCENPKTLILQELGKLKAWRELGYNSFGYPDDFCPFEDDTTEEEIDLAKIVLEAHSQESKIESGPHKKKHRKQLNLLTRDIYRKHILHLWKELLSNSLIDEISEKEFIAHFSGKATHNKINWLGNVKMLVRLMDDLYFMLIPTIYSYNAKNEGRMSMIHGAISPHIDLHGEELAKRTWENTRYEIKEITGKEDPFLLVIETIISDLKKTQNHTTH